MLVTRMIGRAPKFAAVDSLRALASLDWTGSAGKPGIVAYLPAYRDNPYQSLLYSRLSSVGLQAVPVHTADHADEFVSAVVKLGMDVVVHVHWLNAVTNKIRDEAEGREAVKAYLGRLASAKARGAHVVWTVHNVLPHEARWPDLDIELRRSLVDLCDRIHVMSARTRELAAPVFDLPEDKLFVVPHPSYHGVYPTWMSRQQARLELGIARDSTVFLAIGALKPYKGTTELLDAFDQLAQAEPGRFVLLVAGKPDDDEEVRRVCDRLLTHPAAIASFGYIPDTDMQVFLRAADVAVFPYRRSLNSGSLALTLTFGLPAVLPQLSGEAGNVDPSYAELYDADDPGGLLKALGNARRLARPEGQAAATAAGEQIHVDRVSRQFAQELRSWLDGNTP